MHLGAFTWAFAATYPCFLVANAAIVDSVPVIGRLAIGLGALVQSPARRVLRRPGDRRTGPGAGAVPTYALGYASVTPPATRTAALTT